MISPEISDVIREMYNEKKIFQEPVVCWVLLLAGKWLFLIPKFNVH